MGSHNTPSVGRIVVAVLLGSVYGIAVVLVLDVDALYVLAARNPDDNPGAVVNEAPLVILRLFIFWRVRRELRRAARKSHQGSHARGRIDEPAARSGADTAYRLTATAPAPRRPARARAPIEKSAVAVRPVGRQIADSQKATQPVSTKRGSVVGAAQAHEGVAQAGYVTVKPGRLEEQADGAVRGSP